jgi:hypothetical protein
VLDDGRLVERGYTYLTMGTVRLVGGWIDEASRDPDRKNIYMLIRAFLDPSLVEGSTRAVPGRQLMRMTSATPSPP